MRYKRDSRFAPVLSSAALAIMLICSTCWNCSKIPSGQVPSRIASAAIASNTSRSSGWFAAIASTCHTRSMMAGLVSVLR
ncbi:hypothetical protein D3C80_1684960 [compost metagenome]